MQSAVVPQAAWPPVQEGRHPELDAALVAASATGAPVYVLFPGAGAADVGAVALERRRRLAAARPEAALGAARALPLAFQ